MNGRALDVKKVGDDNESCSSSMSVTACIGPGVMCGFGNRVDISSSDMEEAQPVQAAAKRSQVNASQNVCALRQSAKLSNKRLVPVLEWTRTVPVSLPPM